MNLLESDLRKSIDEQGYWGRRLRDVIGKFGSSSPFDYMLWDGFTFVAVECKMLRARKSGNPKSFPFSSLSDDQFNGLRDISKWDNSKAFVMVNFRWTNNKKGETFLITINHYMYLKEYMDRKSIPLDKFRDDDKIISLERKDSGWDLSPLFLRKGRR